MQKTEVKEKDLQRTILAYLAAKRVFFWRNNSGAFMSDTGHFVRYGAKGSPDIIAIENGALYGIEVKGTKGRQSPAQREFQKDLEEAGGVYILARTLEDVQKILGVNVRVYPAGPFDTRLDNEGVKNISL